MKFPLTLRPVVRARERGSPGGTPLPYHPMLLLVDDAGNHVAEVGPDADDVRAGRAITDPHQLVARAARIVAWLDDLNSRLVAWADTLQGEGGLLSVRPVISIDAGASRVEAGLSLCSVSGEEFDRVTHSFAVRCRDEELAKGLAALQERTLKRCESALTMLTALRSAVDSWRAADEVTASSQSPMRIADSALEH